MNILEKLNTALDRINAMSTEELQTLIDELNQLPEEITKSYARVERMLLGEDENKTHDK